MALPSPGPWTRKDMQLIGTDGIPVLTVGFSDSAKWPNRDVAEENIQRVLIALALLADQEAE